MAAAKKALEEPALVAGTQQTLSKGEGKTTYTFSIF
jgi:hypothetical protein